MMRIIRTLWIGLVLLIMNESPIGIVGASCSLAIHRRRLTF